MGPMDLETRVTSLGLTSAARGGLDGGEGSPEEGTSGIPLCPGDPSSGVMESLNGAVGVGQVATGKDAGHAGGGSRLATVIITIIFTEIFHWRHCERLLEVSDWLISRLFSSLGRLPKEE